MNELLKGKPLPSHWTPVMTINSISPGKENLLDKYMSLSIVSQSTSGNSQAAIISAHI